MTDHSTREAGGLVGHVDTRHPHCSADLISKSGWNEKSSAAVLRQSGRDRSTILARARCGGRPAPGAAESRRHGWKKKVAQGLLAIRRWPWNPLHPWAQHPYQGADRLSVTIRLL